MEGHKSGMDAAAGTIPPMQTNESNRIAIIVSPRAASSKIMPFELVNAGGVISKPRADPAESSDAHATHHHQWNHGLPKIKVVPLIKKVQLQKLNILTGIYL